MEVTEHNRDRQEHDVSGVLLEEPDEFYHLGEGEHENELCPKGISLGCGIPIGRPLPERDEEQWVDHKGQGCEGGDMQGVCAPRLLSKKFPRLLES